MQIINSVNWLLGALTVLGQGIFALLLVGIFVKRQKWATGVLKGLSNNRMLLAFIVAFISMAGSLFYSEVAGYEPCKLCWYQRILMYPQVLLLGIGLLRKDENISRYCIYLSGLGVLIAGYHYLLQLGIAPGIGCSAVGYSVSCSQRFVMQFGYITIPLMALTAFLLIITALKAKS